MSSLKLNIDFSSRTKGLAKFDAPFPMIVFAQLVACGFNPTESAWAAKFAFNKTSDSDTIIKTGRKLMQDSKVNELIDNFKKEINKANRNNPRVKAEQTLDILIANGIAESGEMDKRATAMEILRIARVTPDSKEKADLMMKYADLMGFKKADEKQVDLNHMHMYLPSTCDKCPVVAWVKENAPDALQPIKLPFDPSST